MIVLGHGLDSSKQVWCRLAVEWTATKIPAPLRGSKRTLRLGEQVKLPFLHPPNARLTHSIPTLTLRTQGTSSTNQGEMSDTEAVPDTPVEETPKGEEEPLNDVSSKVEREEGGEDGKQGKSAEG